MSLFVYIILPFQNAWNKVKVEPHATFTSLNGWYMLVCGKWANVVQSTWCRSLEIHDWIWVVLSKQVKCMWKVAVICTLCCLWCLTWWLTHIWWCLRWLWKYLFCFLTPSDPCWACDLFVIVKLILASSLLLK